MNILFIGDIVGDRAVTELCSWLPGFRAERHVGLVVANAENCAPTGLGMAEAQVRELLAAGVDVITGGNHSWDSEESVKLLELPQVLRPLNIGAHISGRGLLRLDTPAGEVTVVNLADHSAMRSVKAIEDTFRPAYGAWRDADPRGLVLVDYHGDHVLEKQIFARAVDGVATAVLGTHSHEATIPLHVLPGGTGFVTEVGMTGPADGVQGFSYDILVKGLRETGDPFSGGIPGPSGGPVVLGAVLLETDGKRTVRVERITW
ncbi:YmdB family metallophosphoesterase [Streptomyces eurythermus]|uniref:YmdB family metallophosphoesterase n=1 Tax=Streptomyces eurythermus TaxID=42237 RepID=UPI00369AD8C2